jgi:hypothetical protein
VFVFKIKRLAVLIAFILTSLAAPQVSACELVLWPTSEVAQKLRNHYLLAMNLRKQADKALRHEPAPVKTLRSAGVTDKSDPGLKASRRAFRDADNAAVAALAYAAFDDPKYLDYVKKTLLRWAEINVPTGHPIDETRLEGLLWAFDLICTDLSVDDAASVRYYFQAMRKAKRRWHFGPKTQNNNHKTHHLKMLILLDKVLNDDESLARDTAAARTHLGINIDKGTGVSIDFLERDALYYHVYNLEAWLEIALLTECCVPTIRTVFQFSASKILSGQTNGEFERTQAKIDRQRGQAGFQYAKRNGTYEVKRASRAILTYSTLTAEPLDPKLWKLIQDPAQIRKLCFYFVRRVLWQNS